MIRPGLLRSFLHDGRIVVFTATDVSPALIDAWAEQTIAYITHHPIDLPCLILHDFSRQNLVFTPYGRQRAADAVKARPEMTGRAAVLLPRGAPGMVVRMIMNHLRQYRGGRQQQAFLTMRHAQVWLEEALFQMLPAD